MLLITIYLTSTKEKRSCVHSWLVWKLVKITYSSSQKGIHGQLKQVTSYASFVRERLSCIKSTLRNITFVGFLMPNRLLIVDCFNFWYKNFKIIFFSWNCEWQSNYLPTLPPRYYVQPDDFTMYLRNIWKEKSQFYVYTFILIWPNKILANFLYIVIFKKARIT